MTKDLARSVEPNWKWQVTVGFLENIAAKLIADYRGFKAAMP